MKLRKKRQLECRIIITHQTGCLSTFALGMYDPISGRYEPLGKHPTNTIDKVVRDLKHRMEVEGHSVTFSEVTAPR